MDKGNEAGSVIDAPERIEQASKRHGTLQSVIAACCDELSIRGDEFDADDVVSKVMLRAPELVDQRAGLLVKHQLRKMVRDMLRRSSGLNDDEDGEQMDIPDVGKVPQNMPFQSTGRKVKLINTLHATAQHIRSSLELSEDNIKRCVFRRDQKLRLLDFLRHSGKETVGEALDASSK